MYRESGGIFELRAHAIDSTSELAEVIRRQWRRAGWFAVATLVASSPLHAVRRFLPDASVQRGLVLVLIPMVGVLALRRADMAVRRWDVVAGGLLALIAAEAVSVWSTVGAAQELHVLTGTSLLLLALSVRAPTDVMNADEIRQAVSGLLAPLIAFLIASWLVQYFGVVAPQYPSAMHLLSPHGYRLEGLTAHPNSLGWISALTFVIAVASKPSPFVWTCRILAIATVAASDSRTSLVVSGIGVFMVWVFGPERHLSRRVLSAGLLACAGLMAWSVINIRRSSSHDVLTNRDVVWNKLMPYLHHTPLFGYGPDFLQSLRVELLGPYVPSTFYVDAQNQWLSDALQYGFPVAVLTTVLLIALATRGSLYTRRVVLLPVMAMAFIECFSEVPISIWGSTEAAFPLFLIICLAPVARLRPDTSGEDPRTEATPIGLRRTVNRVATEGS
jgi:hypothetical protein